MADRVYLSTYIIKLKGRENREDLFLSRFYDSKDFFDVYKEFLIKLGEMPYDSVTGKEKHKKTLNIGGKISHSETKRTIEGFFESGISGEKAKINNVESGDTVFNMERNHAKMVPTYFQLTIPKDRKFAYLILQKDSHFGIKILFERALSSYLTSEFDKKVFLEINSFLVKRLFDKLVKDGRFFELSFIKNVIPDHMEEMYDKGHKKVSGKLKTIITSTKSLPIKELFAKLTYRSQKDGMIEIPELSDSFDEVDFEIEYNGTKKTIHMNKNRSTVPDFDVTENIDMDQDGNPTIESLSAQATVLVSDMIEFYEAKIKNV